MSTVPRLVYCTVYWWLGFSCFGILACRSLADEITQKAKEETKTRETLWDIAKFFLICMVWFMHAGLPHSLYASWFMPAFFFLSGLTCKPAQLDFVCVRKIAPRMFRDNILNVILYELLVRMVEAWSPGLVCSTIPWYYCPTLPWYGPLGVVPWFLIALSTCRILIPVCFHFAQYAGHICGSIITLAIAFCLPFLLNSEGPPDFGPLFMRGLWQSWTFYAFGFLADPQWLAKKLQTRLAGAIVLAILGTFGCLWMHGFICVPQILHGESWDGMHEFDSYPQWQHYVKATIAKQICIVLFLACLAPIACLGGIAAKVVAQLGQRTLHAYLISIFLLTIGQSNLSWQPPVLQFAGCILAASVACCPLSEWCVGFITSPQWILDGSARVISMAWR
jgi:fucose 4-O-acetylase-like acetyltransferase